MRVQVIITKIPADKVGTKKKKGKSLESLVNNCHLGRLLTLPLTPTINSLNNLVIGKLAKDPTKW